MLSRAFDTSEMVFASFQHLVLGCREGWVRMRVCLQVNHSLIVCAGGFKQDMQEAFQQLEAPTGVVFSIVRMMEKIC